MTKSKILVAAHQLRGGTKNGPWVIEGGEEITAGMRKSHGLNAEELEALKARGAIKEVSARTATAEDQAEALADAEARAAKAEAEVKELTQKVAELEKQLDAATKPAG